jgi:signal peptidase I
VYTGVRTVPFGKHWVGDLAVECQVEVVSDGGQLTLELIEAGRHHRCTIDVATGQAQLDINGGLIPFDGVGGEPEVAQLVGTTRLKGPGKYTLRFANVDNQLRLWINDKVCDFGHPATYSVDIDQEIPVSSNEDPGDLAPVRIGVTGLQANFRRLQILRDVYYVAQNLSTTDGDYERATDQLLVSSLMNPSVGGGELFLSRRSVDFELKEDQFFPLGDNSPMSKDGRLWGDTPFLPGRSIPHYVERDMLIGKAVFVYWPHPYHLKIPFINKTIPIFPNFKDMKLIH